LNRLDAGQLALLVTEGARDLLRRIRVIPEVGNARFLAQFGDLGGELLDAHDRADVGERRTKLGDFAGNVEFIHGVLQTTGARSAVVRECGIGAWRAGCAAALRLISSCLTVQARSA